MSCWTSSADASWAGCAAPSPADATFASTLIEETCRKLRGLRSAGASDPAFGPRRVDGLASAPPHLLADLCAIPLRWELYSPSGRRRQAVLRSAVQDRAEVSPRLLWALLEDITAAIAYCAVELAPLVRHRATDHAGIRRCSRAMMSMASPGPGCAGSVADATLRAPRALQRPISSSMSPRNSPLFPKSSGIHLHPPLTVIPRGAESVNRNSRVSGRESLTCVQRVAPLIMCLRRCSRGQKGRGRQH